MVRYYDRTLRGSRNTNLFTKYIIMTKTTRKKVKEKEIKDLGPLPLPEVEIYNGAAIINPSTYTKNGKIKTKTFNNTGRTNANLNGDNGYVFLLNLWSEDPRFFQKEPLSLQSRNSPPYPYYGSKTEVKDTYEKWKKKQQKFYETHVKLINPPISIFHAPTSNCQMYIIGNAQSLFNFRFNTCGYKNENLTEEYSKRVIRWMLLKIIQKVNKKMIFMDVTQQNAGTIAKYFCKTDFIYRKKYTSTRASKMEHMLIRVEPVRNRYEKEFKKEINAALRLQQASNNVSF